MKTDLSYSRRIEVSSMEESGTTSYSIERLGKGGTVNI